MSKSQLPTSVVDSTRADMKRTHVSGDPVLVLVLHRLGIHIHAAELQSLLETSASSLDVSVRSPHAS